MRQAGGLTSLVLLFRRPRYFDLDTSKQSTVESVPRSVYFGGVWSVVSLMQRLRRSHPSYGVILDLTFTHNIE